ncbi:hypothetical protein GCM10011365_01550 [Marinicella pacifica]|uniref:Uncharacterized protein n=2 Tax=Marinicella pacifica TaxID=1171543 RepID=A0A917CF69_9GAMM|nr:hypothetical protein GCM10011365_01550 [Marinicella pacifica]
MNKVIKSYITLITLSNNIGCDYETLEKNMKITGIFTVKLNPLDFYADAKPGLNLGRMSMVKTFYRELNATSQGEMLSAMTICGN